MTRNKGTHGIPIKQVSKDITAVSRKKEVLSEKSLGTYWPVIVFLFSGATSIAAFENLNSLQRIDLSDADFSNTKQLISFLFGVFAVISTFISGLSDKDEEPQVPAFRNAVNYP